MASVVNVLSFHINLQNSKRLSEKMCKILEEFSQFSPKTPKIFLSNFIKNSIEDLTKEYLIEFKLDLNSIHDAEFVYNEISDEFECFIMRSLYNKTFGNSEEEKVNDYKFEQLCDKLSWILPEHLEIDKMAIDKKYIELAVNSK